MLQASGVLETDLVPRALLADDRKAWDLQRIGAVGLQVLCAGTHDTATELRERLLEARRLRGARLVTIALQVETRCAAGGRRPLFIGRPAGNGYARPPSALVTRDPALASIHNTMRPGCAIGAVLPARSARDARAH